MDIIVNDKDLTFKDIEETVFDICCKLAVEITQKILKEIDNTLMKERDKSKYRHKGLKEDHIRCVYGDVPYERAVYQTENEEGHKEFIYLLNDTLKMDTVGKISMNVCESIVGSATKMSFRDASEELNRNTKVNISHQAIWNVIQLFGDKLEKEEAALIRDYQKEAIEGGKKVSVLFEEADGVFIHLQGKDRPKRMSGKEIKVSTCYEGWNKDGELVGKVMSVGFEDGETFQQLREAEIKKRYDTEAVKLRVLNGDGADWVKKCEDPRTVFQLDRFHIYKKIREDIPDKKAQAEITALYDACRIKELLEYIRIYTDSIAGEDENGRKEKKALDLYGYLKNNEEYLISYMDRGIKVPEAPEGIIYKNLGTQENQNCSNITLRMKHRKTSWSISGGAHMGKILARFANRTVWDDIARYKDAVIESDKAPIVYKILSAAQVPEVVGKGNKNGNILTGHVVYRDAEMTLSRKAFLKIFANRNFSELIYR